MNPWNEWSEHNDSPDWGRDIHHDLKVLGRALRAQGEWIMAQIDDLGAAQATTLARIAEVAKQVTDLQAAHQVATDLTAAIAAEAANKAALDAIPANAL